MAITKQQKDDILQGLVDKFAKSKSVIFTDYRGLDVASVSDLRTKLREGGAEAKVAKKTLMRLAAKDQKIDEIPDEILDGPVAATFSYEDELGGLKILFNFSKENEKLKLLGGIIDGKIVGKDEIIQLAKLPSRDELLAKLIGSMNAPVSGFVGIMSNLMSGFVRVVSAYKETLPADGAAPAEVAEEAPSVEVETEEKTEKEAPAEAPAEESESTEEAPSTEEAEAPAEAEEKA
ncbi:50S ribosomal protein L10, partial [Candidatus Pacearchaeota archaeon]|nr:50S ribosomal protein L10 [Candidatus Pacearchaeota archaeon]